VGQLIYLDAKLLYFCSELLNALPHLGEIDA
jgi:hypothetical protein